MRINAINTFGSYSNYPLGQTKNCRKLKDSVEGNPPESSDKPAFKGVGGAAGATIGTLAGIGLGTLLTIGTGGLAVPLIASMFGCAAGAIGGDVLESKIKGPNDSNDDNNYNDYFDSSTYV